MGQAVGPRSPRGASASPPQCVCTVLGPCWALGSLCLYSKSFANEQVLSALNLCIEWDKAQNIHDGRT